MLEEPGWPRPNQFCREPGTALLELGQAAPSRARGRRGWVGFVPAAAFPPPEPPGDAPTPSPTWAHRAGTEPW